MFFAYQSTLNITQQCPLLYFQRHTYSISCYCGCRFITETLTALGVYSVSRWELEEWAKILPQKKYKQTLIIIGATEEATMGVIMVQRHNQGTECCTI